MAYVHEHRAHITNSQNGRNFFVLFSLFLFYFFELAVFFERSVLLLLLFPFSTHRSFRLDSIRFVNFAFSAAHFRYMHFFMLSSFSSFAAVLFFLSYSRLMSMFFFICYIRSYFAYENKIFLSFNNNSTFVPFHSFIVIALLFFSLFWLLFHLIFSRFSSFQMCVFFSFYCDWFDRCIL